MSGYMHGLAEAMRHDPQPERRSAGHARTRAAFELAINALDRALTAEERIVASIMFRAGAAHAMAMIAPERGEQ